MTDTSTSAFHRLATPLCLLFLMIAGAWLRVRGTSDFAYNLDEWMELFIARGRTLSDVIRHSQNEVHPPLAQILRHAWFFAFDPGNRAAQRGFALLPGLLLIPLYYAFASFLSGPRAGWCAAILVAFGYGFVTQSYLVRNYSYFLLFLTLYAYAGFHYVRSPRLLTLLFAFTAGCAALATNFTASITILALGCAGWACLWRKRGPALQWLSIHACLGAAFLLLYHYWNRVPALQADYLTTGSDSLALSASRALLFTSGALDYDLTSSASGHPWLLIVYFALLVLSAALLLRSHRVLALAFVFAWLTAAGLILFHQYFYAGSRHETWMAPFLILLLSIAIGESRLPHRYPVLAGCASLLACGCLCYQSGIARLNDQSEYTMKESAWQSLQSFLAGLSARDTILTDRTHLFFLADPDSNPYDAFGIRPIIRLKRGRATIIAELATTRLYNADMLLDLAKAADASQWLDQTDRLLFFTTVWPVPPVLYLSMCPGLEKTITPFPPAPVPAFFLTSTDAMRSSALFVTVTKLVFDRDLLAASGTFQPCLSGKSSAL